MAIRVDEIPRHILAKRQRWGTAEIEVISSQVPRHHRCRLHGADLEPISRQETFHRQDSEGVHVVIAFGLPPSPATDSLEPPHQVLATPVKGVLVRVQYAAPLPLLVQPAHLSQCPIQALLEGQHDLLELTGHPEDHAPKDVRHDGFPIRLGPTALKRGRHGCDELLLMFSDDRVQICHVERVRPNLTILGEHVGRYGGREHALQGYLDLLTIRLA